MFLTNSGLSEDQANFSLSSIQISKAAGPDNIPNRLLRDFSLELAPLVCDIYNQSLPEELVGRREWRTFSRFRDRGYYMAARGYEFYLRVFNSISHE